MASTLTMSGIDRTNDFDDLRHAILRRISPVLRGAGLDDHEIGCTFEGALAHLRVVLTGPAIAASVQQALGVRALDAIHADGRTFGQVEVDCRFGRPIDAGEPTVLDEIDRDECFQLVASLGVGRIAVGGGGGPPLVVPVNYVLDGDTVVFRSDEGSKLVALEEQPASFQVDFVDVFHRTGWSVLIQGVVTEVDSSTLVHLTLEPWAAGLKRHWLRVIPAVVTGRRLRLPEFSRDGRGYL